MDLGTLIGLLAGMALIVGSILMGGTLGMFINIPGILIVFGGTLAATMVSAQLKTFLNAFKVATQAFFNKTPSAEQIVGKVQELAATVRKEDLLALENVNIEEPFIAKGVRMAVDGVSVEVIKQTLLRELASLRERHESGQKVFKGMSSTAPSMGMIGTLIGLVQMLSALDDPSSIGPAMAVALLTTLYGAVLAFMIFGPIADKLGSRTADETRNMKIFLECLESIVNGENQMIIKEKLDAFLAPKQRERAAAA